MLENNCVKCGKLFCPAPYHVYKDDKGFYCSWHCYNHRGDEKRIPKRKMVGMYDENGNLLRAFKSSTEAAEYLGGVDPKKIRKACGSGHPYHGNIWKYIEKE